MYILSDNFIFPAFKILGVEDVPPLKVIFPELPEKSTSWKELPSVRVRFPSSKISPEVKKRVLACKSLFTKRLPELLFTVIL